MPGSGIGLSSFHRTSDGSLAVAWSDGHESLLSPGRLRRACPCAGCRDAAGRRNALNVLSSGSNDQTLVLRSVHPVGQYALTFVWGDGHHTGIYPYPLLRGLCECFGCRVERGEA